MNVSVSGWAIRSWEIRPKMLLAINLMDFRLDRNAQTDRRLGKMLFARPNKIKFSELSRASGPEWIIKAADFQTQEPGVVICNIKIVDGGIIQIHAQEHHVFFW